MTNNTTQDYKRFRLEDENGLVQARVTTLDEVKRSYKFIVNRLGERCYVYDEDNFIWIHNTLLAGTARVPFTTELDKVRR